MLEVCRNIPECESTLQQHLPSVRLLGQLPLTDSDLERIFAYVHQNFSGGVDEGLSSMTDNTPAIFACYLVWKGVQDYDEKGYWKSLSSELGPLDTTLQVKIGKFFREFLTAHNLLLVEIPASYKYVTPILLHGIIPGAMIEQFFERVIFPLIRNDLVNPECKDELAFWLENKRKAAKKTEQLEILLNKLKRVEGVANPMAGWDLPELEQVILQTEEQILQEEGNLAKLRAELNSLQFDPTLLTAIEKNIKTIKRLEEDYEIGIRDVVSQTEALDERHQELQRYNSLGIDDPYSHADYESFRSAAYTAIISAVATALESSEEPLSTEAYSLLEILYDSVSDGNLSIPAILAKQIEVFYQIYGISQSKAEPEPDDEPLFSEVEESLDNPELEVECIAESQPDTHSHNAKSPPTTPCEGEAYPSGDYVDPDITLAHVLASEGPVEGLQDAPSMDLPVEDRDPQFVSRYMELRNMYLWDDFLEHSGSVTDMIIIEVTEPETPETSPIFLDVDYAIEPENVAFRSSSGSDASPPRLKTSPEKSAPPSEATSVTTTAEHRGSSPSRKRKNSSQTGSILSTLASVIIGFLSLFFRNSKKS